MSDEPKSNSCDVAACLVRALVLYSLAEFQAGHCTTIRVDAKEGSFSVSDDGRGHAIERTVAEAPYLRFIYTHLDYPFVPPRDAPIQLHGLGMSLINVLCSELTVLVRKPGVTLRMFFRIGSLCDQEQLESSSEGTGNTISGMVAPQFSQGFDGRALRRWLHRIKTSAPSLNLHFNGQEVHALSQGDA
jgi:DNA gyrase/topoisomerase IV subunit B